MKTTKFVKATLGNVGYVINTEDALALETTNLDADGTLYYTDENDNDVKVLYPSTTPVVVDSDTTAITIADVPTLTFTGETYQIIITNQDGLNVTSECVFLLDNPTMISISNNIGLITVIPSAGSGDTIITATHDDTPTGTTTVTVTIA